MPPWKKFRSEDSHEMPLTKITLAEHSHRRDHSNQTRMSPPFPSRSLMDPWTPFRRIEWRYLLTILMEPEGAVSFPLSRPLLVDPPPVLFSRFHPPALLCSVDNMCCSRQRTRFYRALSLPTFPRHPLPQ
ncbi:unnamed protein product [Ectocarpus sp. 12 AP-2014]